ncbi:MAG: ABC transporter permease, partial [Acidobacteria bacterium]|nr:ABC transporter permease [Acidobacteriota bacterium]
MSLRALSMAGLTHYRGLHALVVAGVAVAVAVLAGALLVGASVRASLRDLALARLGHTELVVSSTGFFRAALAEEVRSPEIAAVVPLLAVPAAVTHDDSRRTATRVQVFGIDDRFFAFHGRAAGAPAGREAWVSPGLAAELGAAPGDNILLRVAKPTDVPLSNLQGRRDDASQRVRLTIARVVERADLGEFSLLPAQGPALSLFVPLSRLQQDLGIIGSANVLLVRMAPPVRDAIADVQAAVGAAAELEDIGLKVRTDASGTVSILESRTGLLPDTMAQAAAARARDQGGAPTGALTYLANAIRANGREIPYSLIAATSLPAQPGRSFEPTDATLPPISLNEWAADDLGVTPGDRVEVDYFLWSDQDGLRSRTTAFTFAGVVSMKGPGGDATLTPEYPGITDAGNVTSWDPPFPVDMSKVRKKDEEYWDRWRAAPKAFIPLEVGQSLWPSAFGSLSSLRTSYLANWPPVTDVSSVLTVRHVRDEALAAAAGTTDFGEYFIYFSFFLVFSALLLAGMFFALGVEQRAKELGLLLAVGYRIRDVRNVLLAEATVLASVGTALGLLGAIGYAALIMHGLR